MCLKTYTATLTPAGLAVDGVEIKAEDHRNGKTEHGDGDVS